MTTDEDPLEGEQLNPDAESDPPDPASSQPSPDEESISSFGEEEDVSQFAGQESTRREEFEKQYEKREGGEAFPKRPKVRYLRSFLEKTFEKRHQLDSFCRDYDLRIFAELHDHATVGEAIEVLISHCERLSIIDSLKDYLAQLNPNRYQEYFQSHGEEFDHVNRVARAHKTTRPSTGFAPSEETQDLKERYENHLLTREDDPLKIQQWFFGQLNRSQQIFLITVALFEMIHRDEIYLLAGRVAALLSEASPEPPPAASSNTGAAEVKAGPVNVNITISPSKSDEAVDKPLTPSAETEEKPKAQPEPADQSLQDDFKLLLETCVIVFPFRPNLTRGATEIQKLRFYKDDQRQKILRLLNQSLHSRLPEFYTLLYETGFEGGDHKAEERRKYAALGVGELMKVINFRDLLYAVVRPWAKSPKRAAKWSAADALSYVAQYYPDEVHNELKNWLRSDNYELVTTALFTHSLLCRNYRDQRERGLLVAKQVLTSQKSFLHYIFNERMVFLSLLAVNIIEMVYDLQPELVITHLRDWLVESYAPRESFLRYTARLLFLELKRLDDVLGSERILAPLREDEVPETIHDLVDITFTLWQGENVHESDRYQTQERTTQLIEQWALAALRAKDKNRQEMFEAYRAFFYELYELYEHEKRTTWITTCGAGKNIATGNRSTQNRQTSTTPPAGAGEPGHKQPVTLRPSGAVVFSI